MSAIANTQKPTTEIAAEAPLPSHLQRKTLLEELPFVLGEFQKRQGLWVTSHCQTLSIGDVHYYGIQKEEQLQGSTKSTRWLYQRLKFHLLQGMGLTPSTPIVQIVGDSAPFSKDGTKRAKELLQQRLSPSVAILYGYTGHAKEDGTRCVNGAVTDVIAEKELGHHTLGNIVGFHTPTALKSWGCSGPPLQHYLLVYGMDETCRERGTVFGDDVTTSDFLGDELILLEGGAQSFRQVCNALLLDQPLTILSGLRDPERASAPDGTPYFSAARFLRDVARQSEDLEEWYESYFGQGKCYVGDPRKPDFDTKQKLLDAAWALFMAEKLYLKLPSLKKVLSDDPGDEKENLV